MRLFVKSFVEHFIDDTPFEFQYAFVYTEDTKLLEVLSDSRFYYIRQLVASNINTTEKTLEKLALSEGRWLYQFIKEHKNATEKVKRLILLNIHKLRAKYE
jgi:hemerythrin superfamily protein